MKTDTQYLRDHILYIYRDRRVLCIVTCTDLMKTVTEYLRDRRVLCILCYQHKAKENGHTLPEGQTCSLHSLLPELSL